MKNQNSFVAKSFVFIMSLLHCKTASSTGRIKIIAEGSYMYVYYYKLMFPYKHGILDPAYFISFNRQYITFLGASILAYFNLSLDDWSVINNFHGEYQDQKLFNLIKLYTEDIVKGIVNISDIVNSISVGSEYRREI